MERIAIGALSRHTGANIGACRERAGRQADDSASAEGEHVRSFQMMARRLRVNPALARILVHKTGPLSDYPDGVTTQYGDVFARGIAEVGKIVGKAVVRPT
jgi:hypothetical protein